MFQSCQNGQLNPKKKDNGVKTCYCPAVPADITELNSFGISKMHQVYHSGAIIPDYVMNRD